MKRKYIQPTIGITRTEDEPLMRANSINNDGKNDVQIGITDNGDEDFEAGAKDFGQVGFRPWNDWND